MGKLPHEFALTANGKQLYVTNYGLKSYTEKSPGGNSISIIDVAAEKVVGVVNLGEYRRTHGIERARNGHFFVTLPSRARELTKYRLSSATWY